MFCFSKGYPPSRRFLPVFPAQCRISGSVPVLSPIRSPPQRDLKGTHLPCFATHIGRTLSGSLSGAAGRVPLPLQEHQFGDSTFATFQVPSNSASSSPATATKPRLASKPCFRRSKLAKIELCEPVQSTTVLKRSWVVRAGPNLVNTVSRKIAEFAYDLHAGLSSLQVPEFDDLQTRWNGRDGRHPYQRSR